MSLIDVTIVAGNDAGNPLFASSKLLRLLSNPKWDQLLDAAVENSKIVLIPQISQLIMENVIKYINAKFVDPNLQPIPLCDENVKEYFSAGQFLEMEEIQTFCLDYVKSRESNLQNASFLFKLIGVFDNSVVTCKIREVFMQNSHQLDFLVRKLKSEGVSEDVLTIALVDWLNFREDLKGMNVNLKNLVQEFSSTENKIKILGIFNQNADTSLRNLVFRIMAEMATSSQNAQCNFDAMEQDDETVASFQHSESSSLSASSSSTNFSLVAETSFKRKRMLSSEANDDRNNGLMDIEDALCDNDSNPRKKKKGNAIFVCSVSGCNKVYITPQTFRHHLKVHEGIIVEYSCAYPGCPDAEAKKNWGDLEQFQDHIRIQHELEPTPSLTDTRFLCTVPDCFKYFNELKDYMDHVLSHHTKKFGCSTCPMWFYGKRVLKKHEQLHRILNEQAQDEEDEEENNDDCIMIDDDSSDSL